LITAGAISLTSPHGVCIIHLAHISRSEIHPMKKRKKSPDNLHQFLLENGECKLVELTDLASSGLRQPLDSIRCEDGNRRYVVACMHNCPHRHYCKAFWDFFRAKKLDPRKYYNQDGIGDEVMRRMVIDCDRCQRKDIGEFYSLYTIHGEGEAFQITAEERSLCVQRMGYNDEKMVTFVFQIFKDLEASLRWFHYCEKCFQRVCEGAAAILDVKKGKSESLPRAEKMTLDTDVPSTPTVMTVAREDMQKKPEISSFQNVEMIQDLNLDASAEEKAKRAKGKKEDNPAKKIGPGEPGKSGTKSRGQMHIPSQKALI